MAKTKGPLFSISAHGTVAKALTHMGWKGQGRARKHYKPTNPRSPSQQSNRDLIRFAVWSWQTLGSAEKDSYSQSAKNLKLKMSGYNYYLQTYISNYGITVPGPILSNLISWWKFDENAGPDSFDSYGTNHGTNFETDWVAGKINSCLEYDGNNDYVNVPADSSLNFASHKVSLEAWLYPTSFHAANNIIMHNSAGVFQLYVINTKLYFNYWIGAANQEAFSDTVIPLDTWSHIVVTFDGTNVKFYLNGNLDDTVNLPGVMDSNTGILRIGCFWAAQGWAGKIDEVRIYDRDLTLTEIQNNFNLD